MHCTYRGDNPAPTPRGHGVSSSELESLPCLVDFLAFILISFPMPFFLSFFALFSLTHFSHSASRLYMWCEDKGGRGGNDMQGIVYLRMCTVLVRVWSYRFVCVWLSLWGIMCFCVRVCVRFCSYMYEYVRVRACLMRAYFHQACELPCGQDPAPYQDLTQTCIMNSRKSNRSEAGTLKWESSAERNPDFFLFAATEGRENKLKAGNKVSGKVDGARSSEERDVGEDEGLRFSVEVYRSSSSQDLC